MGFGFERPIGASADVAELEYISALHQTDVQELRQDGTIDGERCVCVCVNMNRAKENRTNK